MGAALRCETDTHLHDSVQQQLERDPEIGSDNLAVFASEGVITLTGYARSYWARLAAERSVRRVRGVRVVVNDIQVALSRERTDPDIARDAA